MAKHQDITGNRYGRLTAIQYAGNRQWCVKCDCGTVKCVDGFALRSGKIRSCGCITKELNHAKLADLSNQKFGRLLALELAYIDEKHRSFWKCKCECGNELIVASSALVRRHTKSCGCYKNDLFRSHTITHGKSKSRIYRIWYGMKSRCYYTENSKYKNYGGRGITVCDEWRNDFQAFYDWAMSNGYNPNAKRGECTLDRIDVNGNYEPSNCRWTDMMTQSNNRGNNRIVEYYGKQYTLSELARHLNIPKSTLTNRLNKGLAVEFWGYVTSDKQPPTTLEL